MPNTLEAHCGALHLRNEYASQGHDGMFSTLSGIKLAVDREHVGVSSSGDKRRPSLIKMKRCSGVSMSLEPNNIFLKRQNYIFQTHRSILQPNQVTMPAAAAIKMPDLCLTCP